MAVAEILVHVPLIGLGGIVSASGALRGQIGRDDRRALFQVQRNMALQADGIGKIITGGKKRGSSAPAAAASMALLMAAVSRVFPSPVAPKVLMS